MNQYEFVLVLVAIVFMFSIVRHKLGMRSRLMPGMQDDRTDSVEAQRLRHEVAELKERIKVLERITVEKENSLAKEIESLRDR